MYDLDALGRANVPALLLSNYTGSAVPLGTQTDSEWVFTVVATQGEGVEYGLAIGMGVSFERVFGVFRRVGCHGRVVSFLMWGNHCIHFCCV